LSGSGGSRAPSSAGSWCDRPRHRRSGVTGTPGGGADGSRAAVHQLGPLLLRPKEACQATGLGRAGARCRESTRDVAAMHARGRPKGSPWRQSRGGAGHAPRRKLVVDPSARWDHAAPTSRAWSWGGASSPGPRLRDNQGDRRWRGRSLPWTVIDSSWSLCAVRGERNVPCLF
jgi:hypothetical protein